MQTISENTAILMLCLLYEIIQDSNCTLANTLRSGQQGSNTSQNMCNYTSPALLHIVLLRLWINSKSELHTVNSAYYELIRTMRIIVLQVFLINFEITKICPTRIFIGHYLNMQILLLSVRPNLPRLIVPCVY